MYALFDTLNTMISDRATPLRAIYIYTGKMYGLLTKCEVKMAGYWPSSFFACLWTETKSRSINLQKKSEANIQPS